MSSEIEQRLRNVVEGVLGPTGRPLSDDDGPGTLPTWDSVAHLNLILAIEDEFDVRFETSEIPDLLSFGKLRARLLS
jgi:acyl carrier protein